MKEKWKQWLLTGAMMVVAFIVLVSVAMAMQSPAVAHAATTSANATTLDTRDPDAVITNQDRNTAYILLIEHMNSIKSLYDLSPAALQRLEAVFYEANVYIANTNMTVGTLSAYVQQVKGTMTAAIGDASLLSDTHSFLFLCNEVPTASFRYGQTATVTISLINLGQEGVTSVVVTPNISTKPDEWPFVITNASDVRMINAIPAADSVEAAYAIRQNLTWNYEISDEAKTGTYPISFHVQYYRNGGNIEETDLTTYINVTGKSSNGELYPSNPEEENNLSIPRIITTGFVTDPEEVFAGDTFNLTITVQNTSQTTAVSNIQFDLQAAQTGGGVEGGQNTTYEAFLPTSGSSTIYVNNIGPGESKDISIEMTARSDLSQKPYVITLHAEYEDSNHHTYDADTNISIPVHQIAKIDSGDVEVLPESIAVGESSNVMFSIYDVGKTTLYNVRVSFDENYVSGGNCFLGKIEPGGTGNVDTMVTAIAVPEDGASSIMATISYEDEAGNVSTVEKEIPLLIYEAYVDDMGYDDMGYDEMGDMYYEDMENAGPSVGLIIGLCVGAAVIIAIVVIIIVVNVKKKKKRLAEQKELEDFADDNLQ